MPLPVASVYQTIVRSILALVRAEPKLNYTDLNVALTGYRDYFRSLESGEEPPAVKERPRSERLLDRLDEAFGELAENSDEDIPNATYLDAFEEIVGDLRSYNGKRKQYLPDLLAAAAAPPAPGEETQEPAPPPEPAPASEREPGNDKNAAPPEAPPERPAPVSTPAEDPEPITTTDPENDTPPEKGDEGTSAPENEPASEPEVAAPPPPSAPVPPPPLTEEERRARARLIGARASFRPRRPTSAGPPPSRSVRAAPSAPYIARSARPRKVKTPVPTREIYQLRVSLVDAEPAVWRRFLVPVETTLAELHRLIQLGFDYSGDELHRFKIGYDYYGPGSPEGMDQRELYDGVTLQGTFARSFNKLTYTYDFAAGWDHLVVIERVLPREEERSYPVCTEGVGAAPPEGSGKVEQFNYLRQALTDKHHDDHDVATERLGQHWDSITFSAEAVNERLGGRW